METAQTDGKAPVSALRVKANRASQQRCTSLVCVLENPVNLENVGAVMRNIDALGIARLYVVSSKWTQRDFGTPGSGGERGRKRLAETSVSASKWVYTRHFATTAECLAHLFKTNFVSVGTSPHRLGAVNRDLRETDFTPYRKLAVWFGNESQGLSPEALQHMAACVQLQMCGIVESLNLSVATGVVLYEIASQRRSKRALDLSEHA